MKKTFKNLILALFLFVGVGQMWAATTAADGRYAWSNQSIGSASKFYRNGTGVYQYRINGSITQDNDLGMKLIADTTSSGWKWTGAMVFYISSSKEITILANKKSTKNEITCQYHVYNVTNGSAAFTNFEDGTNNTTTVTVTKGGKVKEVSKTFDALAKAAAEKDSSITFTLSAGYYMIMGTQSSGYGYLGGIKIATPATGGSAATYTVTAATNNVSYGSAASSASSLEEGKTATITATAESGYRFVSWAVSGTGSTLSSTSTNPTTLTMGTANTTVTATFEAIPTHTVTAATNNASYGTAAAASTTVAEGSTTTITATPNSGYRFKSWAVSGTGSTLSSTSTNPTTLTMGSANATVTATFEEITCPTSGTVLSMVMLHKVSGSDKALTASESIDLGAEEYATVTGGTVTFTNDGAAKGKITKDNPNKINYDSDHAYMILDFDCAIKTGDSIIVTYSGTTAMLCFTSSSSLPAAGEARGDSTILEGGKYYFIVPAKFNNLTKLYAWRSRANGMKMTGLKVTRPASTYTISLWNTASGWNSVNAHVWNNEGNVTTWPGAATTFAAGWNTFEVEKGNSLLFCKADGSAQTVDITNVTADACYVLTGEADGSGHLQLAADNECAARFYVAGNEELTGEDWNAAGSRLEDGSITFTNVPAGSHEFKITNGSWNWSRGAAAFDSDNSNVTNWGESNVGFTTTVAMDITIVYDETTDKITVQAEDYKVPVEPEYRAIVVTFGDKKYAMTTELSSNSFIPQEVTVDNEGNVVVNSEAEKLSILWKYTEGTGTATFQDANNKYLAHKGDGTDFQLADNAETWTWNEEGYYEAVSGRTFFYKDSKFKNYSISDIDKAGKSSGAPTFYDADKVVVSTTAKLKFFAPVAWENVIVNTWGGSDNGDHAMTAVEEGSRWFECDIEKGVSFLIYNGTWGGSNQTTDIAAIEADKCFAWTAATDNDGKIIATEITSCAMSYYIAGDETLTGVAEWGHKALSNNSITFNQVAADTYHFKITNGTWNWFLGNAYLDANACENVTIETTDADGNVVFTIDAESNVTIAYNPATEKISVVASAATPKEYYTKVTGTADIIAGTYLIVYETGNVAFNGGLTTLEASSNTIAVTINDSKIEVSATVDAAAFFLDPEIGTIKSASDKYIGVASNSNGLKQSDKIYTYKNAFSIDDNGNAVIAADFEGSTMKLRYNTGSGQNRFSYYKSGNQDIQLYKKAETAKASPALAFNPTAVEAFKGEAFTAPALSNPGVTVAYEASNDNATVDAAGNVTLKKTGDVTIYAVSAANDDYRESYAKYTISISEYTAVRTELTEGYYYTMCLNKAVTHVRGASIWRIVSKTANGNGIIMEEVTDALDAGRPYFFYATAESLEVVYTGAAVDDPVTIGNNGLVGSFTQALIPQSNDHYILYNNELYYVNTEAYVGANRAYLDMTGVPEYSDEPQAGNSPRRRVSMSVHGQNVATGVDAINSSDQPMKLMIDGQLFILHGEKMYDATGRLVK